MNAPILLVLLTVIAIPAAADNFSDEVGRQLKATRNASKTAPDIGARDSAPAAAPRAASSFFDILLTHGERAPDNSGIGKHMQRALPDGRDETLEAIAVLVKTAGPNVQSTNPRDYTHILAYRHLHTPLGGGRVRGESTEITASVSGHIISANVMSADGRMSPPGRFRSDGRSTRRDLAPDSPEALDAWNHIVRALSQATPRQP